MREPVDNKRVKWIVVTGGVLSGLGKGIVSASIGRLLANGLKIVPVKCDGYLNVDPGTMNPVEHGEVFVLDDGGEVDLDFGHYERFLSTSCKFTWNLTSGKIFQSLVERERRGDFLGKTVQIVPHVTGEIKRKLREIASDEKADVMLIEIGGTVGDLENLWFLEAIRELQSEVAGDEFLCVHLGYIPVIDAQGQQKTKPMQQSTLFLRERGLFPDVFVGRSKERLADKAKEKLHWTCGVEKDAVISDPDCYSVYEIPLIFEEEGLKEKLERKLKLNIKSDLTDWKRLVHNILNPEKEITIAICGKYTELADSYISIEESLKHAGAHFKTRVHVKWIETTDIESGAVSNSEIFDGVQGLIIPGGFGSRGIEGKISAIKYARENNIPFLGLCYGLQLAVVEFARNVCGLRSANSTEVDEDCKEPVVYIMPEQRQVTIKGATMRLGSYEALLTEGSTVAKLYGDTVAHERHRHRYEVNPDYHTMLEKNGLVLSGKSKDGVLVEFIELPGHKYFVATQAHPELKSRLESPAPLFYGLIEACLE
ncbi:CTP synthase (glutamine hydrolyzing) [Candidatus Woesearchaeota archaeon]|jgi:CTP synthase|nr:CTP synthase (glutamine hydrolyzing) [Candidatus Woesearchaeota archaeon]MBT3537354.1 CTP synthase (glutamine hydrolyzing) [Candidatus Woesearchaeota archaeon]MBT4697377.1 CTP synthase (glutamine hydrolyzing) [Candidatus Woesearchaeota archaeon]MBT7106336.1 CTP synthase (glutamine hydrolyzing) [Candidatus Woesearchaeota archaeon]MBT7930766.1 CTP synthase (glutamine hydrolyzing) [Candidatus Woesearchaeota archaeon]